MQRRLRPLAAARQKGPEVDEEAYDPVPSLPLQKRHRVGVPAACEFCRRRKSRCDGQRPSCDRCRREGAECSYITAQGETHHAALKRKYQVAMEENRQLRELFSILHGSPALEAGEVYKRIRSSPDPLDVLQLIKQADLLLPILRRLEATVEGLDDVQDGSRAEQIIHLPPRPWSVAATDRIVPEMMTNLYLKRSILSRSLIERLSRLPSFPEALVGSKRVGPVGTGNAVFHAA